MKQPLIYLTITVALILGPSACGLFQSCPEALPFFQIEGLELTHYRFFDDPYGDPIIENAKIPWQEYGLRTDLKSTYYGVNNEVTGGAYLYALSCVEDGYMGTEAGIDTLYLVALGDYNERFVTNDTLNSIIQLSDYFDGPSFYSLEEYINTNEDIIRSENVTIKLTEGPSQDIALSFELVYVLTTGEEFKQISPVVNIRK